MGLNLMIEVEVNKKGRPTGSPFFIESGNTKA
jgi:hypothetical protein